MISIGVLFCFCIISCSVKAIPFRKSALYEPRKAVRQFIIEVPANSNEEETTESRIIVVTESTSETDNSIFPKLPKYVPPVHKPDGNVTGNVEYETEVITEIYYDSETVASARFVTLDNPADRLARDNFYKSELGSEYIMSEEDTHYEWMDDC